ncbi:hypothetical protein V6B33_11740 [Mangrovibacillus sp. Mu-81]|jgi:hypothetical protein|uniref:hypothetical protein n=1 Tax=Mangrovibacillus sp. Mu-81 TaxID=3121478 RepID=UPI002FE4F998
MKKQRYILCLLLTGALLYYAAPRLSIEAGGLEGAFATAWIVLATFVIAGNLAGLLYSPSKGVKRAKAKSVTPPKKRLRSFGN